MLLSLVGLPAADFLVVDLHWSVELLAELLEWNLQFGVYLVGLKWVVTYLVEVLDWYVVMTMANGQV